MKTILKIVVTIAVLIAIVGTASACCGHCGCHTPPEPVPTPEPIPASIPGDLDSSKLLSSPGLGLGYLGSVCGDHIPALYTYFDRYGDKIVSEVMPLNPPGPVICTPARIACEPLQDNGFWDTAKGKRILEWRSNS